MTLGAPAWLVLLIVALYLKDSLLLLEPDEAVMVRRLGGGWRAGFGIRSWRLAGREPYLANPFAPHQPVLRLTWRMAGAPAAGATATPGWRPDLPAELMRLGVFAWASWLGLFVLIPGLLLARLDALTTLIGVGLVYLNIALSLVATWRWRKRLGLGDRTCALLAFECLACAPYAANLVRRVAATRESKVDFTLAARRLLSPADMSVVNRECLARIDERIESEGDEASRSLQHGRTRFVVEDGDELR
ncbi:hypothetical protein BH11PSE9_BH11PSE9_26160 [soil metagenome]